jgi:3',5'-cyclic-AMP phosphodiesterase
MLESSKLITKLKIKSSDSIKIIQITDTHIQDDDALSFSGFDTSASLLQIIKSIKINESNADLILLTGDLVHKATKSAYQKLADHLLPLTTPVRCLPGNHDDVDMMNDIMGSNGHDVGKVFKIGQWLIILLNTCVTGQHYGELSSSELEFLRTTLQSNSHEHCLIALHHHPVPIHSLWMDAMALTNAKDFLNIIDDFDHVRVIIWGHIHQKFDLIRKNVTLLGSPSTCLQFKPKSDVFTIDEKPPAYRKLVLQSNGIFNTEVLYLSK